MPWVKHRPLDEVKKNLVKGLPDPDTGLGQRVRQCCEHFRERLAPYPRCTKYIHITQPDLQGPFDILHLLLGADVFFDLVDEPETVHEILSLATETYIAYRRFIGPYITDKADDGRKCYVHFGLYGGSVVVKEPRSPRICTRSLPHLIIKKSLTLSAKALCIIAARRSPGITGAW